MRVLHVTDTHLGCKRAVRGAPRGWSRADDHERALRLALREPADLVVHSGDLFDRSRPPRRSMVRAAELLVDLARRVPVVVMPGNHDRRGLLRYLPHRVPGLHVLDQPARVVVGEVALAVVPFRRTAEAWAASARRAVGPGADLLVAHQAFDGHRVPGLTFRVGVQRDTIGAAHLPRGVRHVLCGHIHPRQVVRVGDAQVVCPGSTERTAFSERSQPKGFAVWELGREVSWRFVDLPVRPMVVVEGREGLRGVEPGALVRLVSEEIEEADVLDRGGWLVGAPRGAVRRALPEATQLGLFGRGG